jgi:hypothetical protein
MRVFKLLGYLWRRFGDYQSAIALAELFGFKGAIVTFFGGAVSFILGSLNNDWSPAAIWLAALSGATFAAIIYIAFRLGMTPPRTHLPIVKETNASPTTPKLASIAIRDAGVSEAVAYVCFGQWGKSFFEAAATKDVDGAAGYDQYLQSAADGIVPVWGRRNQISVYEPIPHEYWYKNRIDWFSLLKGDPKTESSEHSFSGDRYLSLMTSRAAIEARWTPKNPEPPDIAESYANVRIADNPSIQELLNGGERTKLLGLLTAGKLDAWARPMRGNRDFVKMPKEAWEKHYIDIHLNSGESINRDGAFKTHSQTYLRTKQRNESTHYDVCLNKAQLLKIWPVLSLVEDHDGAGA